MRVLIGVDYDENPKVRAVADETGGEDRPVQIRFGHHLRVLMSTENMLRLEDECRWLREALGLPAEAEEVKKDG